MRTVSVRGGFSDRNQIDSLNTEIQLTNFDERTRVRFYNAVVQIYEVAYMGKDWKHPRKQEFLEYVEIGIYNLERKMNRYYYEDSIFDTIRETLMKDTYDKVLTVIECIGKYMHNYFLDSDSLHYARTKRTIFDYFNTIFKQEYVGYRFIKGEISRISDETEVQAINNSLQHSSHAVREHLVKANRFLSDRENPDYENSIKESISAVEAICEEFLNVRGKDATLGRMLKQFTDKGIKINKTLQIAFDKLYGYTSDANGIRHAGDIGGPSSTFEEAKFMLVSCSAFINYLMGVSAKL